jgi:hypothetical protein
MPPGLLKTSRPRAFVTPARKTAFGLAITSGILTSTVVLASYDTAQMIGLVQILILFVCTFLCLREPFDGPFRFSPVVIATVAFVLSAFVMPG